MGLSRIKYFLITALILIAGCISNYLSVGDSVKDSDWNVRFSVNCSLPNHDSIRWIDEDRRFLRFNLSDKDKGGCRTDRRARHSAPYWERAELKQAGLLRKNKRYTIDARLRFVEGFNGKRETFFQIHAYNSKCTHAYPPIMIKFDNTHTDTAVLTLNALQSNKRHISYRSAVRIEDILGDWVDLKLKLDSSEENTITLSFNGDTLFSEIPFWIDDCGIMHIKFGVYRPGNLAGNVKSVVDFDSINVN